MKRWPSEAALHRTIAAAASVVAMSGVCASAQTTQPATSEPNDQHTSQSKTLRPDDQHTSQSETLRSEGPLNDREMAFHLLNRLAFGPTPGQVDKIMAMDMGWKQ